MEKVKKICSKCAFEKELSEFNKRSTSKDGYRSDCRECQKSHYNGKSEYYKEKMKQNRLDKLDEYVERDKKYYKENRDKILKSKSGYYIDNRGEILENKRQYYIDNKDVRSEYNKKWREDNKDWVRTYMRNYAKQYREKNPHIIAWRRVLSSSLNRMGKSKEGHTIDLLGYSSTELKEHLESLFTDGMSWDNYGEWHIDHIKEVCTFDVDTPPSIVNALSNLRPLWATTREINGVVYEGNLNRDKFTS